MKRLTHIDHVEVSVRVSASVFMLFLFEGVPVNLCTLNPVAWHCCFVQWISEGNYAKVRDPVPSVVLDKRLQSFKPQQSAFQILFNTRTQMTEILFICFFNILFRHVKLPNVIFF